MPFKIRKSPASNDPRDWNWLRLGWDGSGVAPYKWELQSFGITQFLQRLNGPMVLPLKSAGQYLANYELWDFWPSGPIWMLNVFADAGNPHPPGTPTVMFEIVIQFPGHINPQYGYHLAEFPNPYVTFDVDMADIFGSNVLIPNPVTVRPLPWFAVDSLAG